jgi:hypothetical protein
MSANEYLFVTEWRVEATVEEVSAILSDPLGLVRWWPSVYLDVREIEHGSADGTGRVVELLTKGRLPYRLRWRFRVTESRRPYGFSLEAWGDFVGRGVWTFTQDGAFTNIVYDWKILAQKPLLRRLSFLMKPLFAWNHRWAMARGEESLRAELVRTRAQAGRPAGAGQQSAAHTS